MRLFLDKHYFISVIKKDEKYSCQLMELIHGMGMMNAHVDDENQHDIVSSIVPYFQRDSIIASSIEEIFLFHKELLLQILKT